MDEIRDDTPNDELRNEQSHPDERQDDGQPVIDPNGNVKGPIFSFSSEHLVTFTDEAITDPVELAKLRKPKPDA